MDFITIKSHFPFLRKAWARSSERQCELLYLTRIDKDKAAAGNRGVIESISLKPLPVTSTDDIHRQMLESGDPFRKFFYNSI